MSIYITYNTCKYTWNYI